MMAHWEEEKMKGEIDTKIDALIISDGNILCSHCTTGVLKLIPVHVPPAKAKCENCDQEYGGIISSRMIKILYGHGDPGLE